MKISAIKFNNTRQSTYNSQNISFNGCYENYIKTFNNFGYQRLGQGFSNIHNKNVAIGTYTNLINTLKQFPTNCRTNLFDRVFNDSKYSASPFTLLNDLHEGVGSIACQALSVEASKHHNCNETPYHLSYPLISNPQNNKACLVLARIDLDAISKGIRSLFGCEDEKNGFFRLMFIKDFHHRITYDLTDSGHFFFCNVSEDASTLSHLYYKAHEFHRDFEHYKSYRY